MIKHWDEAEKQKANAIDFEQLLNEVHHEINLGQNSRSKISMNEPWIVLMKPFQIRVFIRRISKIAAILFLPLLFTFAYYLFFGSKVKISEQTTVYNEVSTPLSSKASFTLPDGTNVWLNAGSTLIYPLHFSDNSREVSLSGEGYFEVIHNEKALFKVKTDELIVTAYGTSFNVMAYPDEQSSEITLVEGSIKMENTDMKYSTYLEPSQRAVFSKNSGKISKSSVDTRFYTSWKDGKLIFRNEPMAEVVKKLERWFNSTIILENRVLRNHRFTGNIEMESLEEVMVLISITTPIKYEYNKDKREMRIEPRI